MALATSKVTAQGQISIPAAVRRKLGIEPGSKIEWTEHKGKIIVRRAGKSSWEELRRKLFPDGLPPKKTLAELKAAIPKYILERHARDGISHYPGNGILRAWR